MKNIKILSIAILALLPAGTAFAQSQNSTPPKPPMSGEMGGRHEGGKEIMAAVSKALGLTEQDLHDQLSGGKTIADIAKAKNIDLGTIKASVEATIKQQLAAAVKDGKLSQNQADEMLKRFQSDSDFFSKMGMPHNKH